MVCRICGKDKPKEQFVKDAHLKTGVKRICKPCHNAIVQKYRKEHPQQAKNSYEKDNLTRQIKRFDFLCSLKTNCVKCGENRLCAIDFHHINPMQKSFDIGSTQSQHKFDEIEAEAKKCVCLCRNCHMEFHHIYGQRPQFPIEALSEYLGREVSGNV